MLVFSRKRDEAIVIGDGIEVRVLRTGKDAVRIGVTAPADVLVHRREVYDAVRAANQSAAAAVPPLTELAGLLKLQPPLERVEQPPMPRTDPWSLAAPGELAPVFAADADRWRHDLRWDTRDLWEAIERARTSGRLEGLVHRDDAGHVAGWTYFVARDGDVHCGALEATTPAATAALVEALLATPAGAAAERVLLFVYSAAPALEDVLRRHAFDLVPYDYRVRAFGAATRGATPGRAWDLRDLDATAAVLQAAYARTDPRRPFAPHGTTTEWRQYVGDLVMGQGCGRFRPTLSVAVPAERGGLDGVALLTDLGEGTAHLAQIAVRPSARGAGLGAAMLEAVTRQAAAAGFRRLSLLVERENARAAAMYARDGLAVQATFVCAVRPGRRLDGWTGASAAVTASR